MPCNAKTSMYLSIFCVYNIEKYVNDKLIITVNIIDNIGVNSIKYMKLILIFFEVMDGLDGYAALKLRCLFRETKIMEKLINSIYWNSKDK